MKASEGGEEADISVVERKRDLTAGEYVQPEITSRSTAGRLVPEEGFNAARTSFGTVGLSVDARIWHRHQVYGWRNCGFR